MILFSNDCHFAALNTRGLNVLGIGRDTPDPPDGKILRGAGGAPTGIIEDGPAMRYYDSVSQVREGAAARVFGLAFEALHRQGVTTVMDTRALPESFEAARFMGSRGELGVRFLGAREVTPADCPTPGDAAQAVSRALAFVREYDGGEPGPEPGVNLRHLKFFVDGMPTNLTAYTQTPYFEDFGAPGAPDWREGTLRGAPYFTEEQLKALFVETAAQGLHPHCHIIADGAAELVINAIAAMRRAHPGKDIRPAMAHLDVLTPDQYGKIARARAVAVLSFQWCGQPEELIEFQRNLYGPVRFEGLETHGKLIDAGVTVAYGSDWPIDPLNEWGNFQVGLTRRMLGGAPDAFPRLANDRDLALGEVLAAATRNAAWALGMERHIGTLEPGKLADLAIIEGDLFARKPHEIAATRVTRTVIGGKTVFKA